MKTESGDSQVVNSIEFLKSLSISDEEKNILAAVISAISVQYSLSLFDATLGAIFGDSKEDQEHKTAILNIVHDNADEHANNLTETIIRMIKED